MVEPRRHDLPTGPLALLLIMVALFLLIVHLPLPVPTGAIAKGGAGYEYILEQSFAMPGGLAVELPERPASVAFNAEIIGSGSAAVYLRTAMGMRKVFSIDGDTSKASERRRSVRQACEESCANIEVSRTLDFDVVVNGATLTIHNISYAPASTPTGAAVIDTDATASTILSCDAYEWLQIALTILTVMLVVFGPLRQTREGRRASVPAAIGIMALIAATGLLALLDALNCNYIPVAVLVTTICCALILDVLLARSKHLPRETPFRTDKLTVFTPGDGMPDEREIRRKLEEIRRRLRE
jgi:hypothetical protein